jgi:hypothetical protein
MSTPGGTTAAVTRPPWALGLCDICGFSWKLNQLKAVIYDQRPTGSLACPDCWDVDNPQLQLGLYPINDPQSLLNPRPDTGRQGSTTYFGWLPIGNPITEIECQVGNVTVS